MGPLAFVLGTSTVTMKFGVAKIRRVVHVSGGCYSGVSAFVLELELGSIQKKELLQVKHAVGQAVHQRSPSSEHPRVYPRLCEDDLSFRVRGCP